MSQCDLILTESGPTYVSLTYFREKICMKYEALGKQAFNVKYLADIFALFLFFIYLKKKAFDISGNQILFSEKNISWLSAKLSKRRLTFRHDW